MTGTHSLLVWKYIHLNKYLQPLFASLNLLSSSDGLWIEMQYCFLIAGAYCKLSFSCNHPEFGTTVIPLSKAFLTVYKEDAFS